MRDRASTLPPRFADEPDGPWVPLEQYEQHPDYMARALKSGTRPALAVFGNDTYDIAVYQVGDGPLKDSVFHLSIKRRDRHVIRDWRHLQAIKNEIFTSEHYAFEIYPPESKLVDTANQYHLWVLPLGYELPFGFDEQLISSDYQADMFNAAREAGVHKGRQRPFQENLPVATTRNLKADAAVDFGTLDRMQPVMRQKVPE